MSRTNHKGEKCITYQGYEATIIDSKGSLNNTIQFNDSDGTILYNVAYKRFQMRNIRNPYHPTILGVGYTGIGKYKSEIKGKATKEYYTWQGILTRS